MRPRVALDGLMRSSTTVVPSASASRPMASRRATTSSSRSRTTPAARSRSRSAPADSPGRGSTGYPQHIGIRERIAQHRLEQHSRTGEARTDECAEQHPRKPHAQDDVRGVRIDEQLTVRGRIEPTRVEAEVGEGGDTLRVRTSGGDIRIRVR